jgi:hypothetical protein
MTLKVSSFKCFELLFLACFVYSFRACLSQSFIFDEAELMFFFKKIDVAQ